jgi:hypothetical protein
MTTNEKSQRFDALHLRKGVLGVEMMPTRDKGVEAGIVVYHFREQPSRKSQSGCERIHQ